MQTIFVNARGLRFEVLQAGSGDRLALCLHGFPEHAVSWRHQMPELARMGYRVWAVNQRGYGRTSRPRALAAYALGELVADVAALIDASGAVRVTLIGHDWGAMVAWCFAAGQVRPLERLVVMNVPHPLCFRAALRHWRQLRRSWYIAFFQIPRLPDRLLAANGGAAVRRMFARLALPPDILAIYADQIAEPGAATAMLNWYRAMRLRDTPRPDLSRIIETPVLVVWGEQDVALDPICLRGTERYVRHLALERLRGVSHWVQQDAPDAVNALLRRFLEQHPTNWNRFAMPSDG
ncbi:alpha/beta fold hydrolase [Lichenicoccus sp.]|uniref:alpha/beta fold hydrolase n=1 Tax=Lichenicoccus sp. TaxID=2781899 RepID=UPI003D0EFA71